MRTVTKDKALTGAAGEYYVAFQLAAREYAVGMTPRGTTSIDLIVANPVTRNSITIQTKTAWNAFHKSKMYTSYWRWRVGKTREAHETFFYAFVDLKGNLEQPPDVFIVPSVQLKSLLNKHYPDWCDEINVDNESKYKNQWGTIVDLLEQSS